MVKQGRVGSSDGVAARGIHFWGTRRVYDPSLAVARERGLELCAHLLSFGQDTRWSLIGLGAGGVVGDSTRVGGYVRVDRRRSASLPTYSATPSRIQALAMTDISQILPPELLAEILERVSIPDVLAFKQVRNHPLKLFLLITAGVRRSTAHSAMSSSHPP